MSRILILFALTSGLSAQAASVSCKATSEIFDKDGIQATETKDLEVITEMPGLIKLETSMGDYGYAVAVDEDPKTKAQEVRLTIAEAPNYTNAMMTRAGFENGFARLSQTQEIEKGKYTLRKIECYRR